MPQPRPYLFHFLFLVAQYVHLQKFTFHNREKPREAKLIRKCVGNKEPILRRWEPKVAQTISLGEWKFLLLSPQRSLTQVLLPCLWQMVRW